MRTLRLGVWILVVTMGVGLCAASGGDAPGLQKVWSSAPHGSIVGAPAAVPVAGRNDRVAVGCGAGWLVLYDAAGAQVWERRLTAGLSRGPAVGDVDGDGSGEIVVADQAGKVQCFDVTGKLRWMFWLEGKLPDWMLLNKRLHGWCYAGTPCLGDVNGDGLPEVLTGDVRGWVTCLDGRGNLLWRVRMANGVNASPAVGDVDGDGSAEVVFGCADSRMYCLAATGELKWSVPAPGDPSRCSPVMADLKGDGRPAVVTGTNEGRIVAFRGDGKELWRFQSDGVVRATLAAADVDGDGKQEVVFGNEGDRRYGRAELYCLDANGKPKWRLGLENEGAFLENLCIGDVDGDGQPEIVAPLTYRGRSVIIVSSTGQIKARQATQPLEGIALSSGLGANDNLKLLIADNQAVACLDTGVNRAKAPILWPQPAPTPTGRHARGSLANAEIGKQSRGRLVIGAPVPGEGVWREVRVTAPATWGEKLNVLVNTPAGSRYAAIAQARRGDKQLSASLRFEALADGPYNVEARLLDKQNRLIAHTTRETRILASSDARAQLGRRMGQIRRQQAAFARDNAPAARHLRATAVALEGQRKQLADFAGSTERARREYMSALNATLGEASRVVAWAETLSRVQRGKQAVAFIAGTARPWDDFDPATTPAAAANEMSADCYQGEYRSLVLNVGNFRDTEIAVRATAGWPAGMGGPATADDIGLREVVPVRGIRGATVWDALMPLKAGGLLRIPPWQARQLWITVHAPRAKPGEYRAEVNLEPVGIKAPAQKIALRVRVLPLARPLKSPLSSINWESIGRWPEGSAARQSVLDDLLSHGTNVFLHVPTPSAKFNDQGDLITPIDFSAHDRELKPVLGKAQLLFTGPQYAISGPAEYPSPIWKKAYAAYLAAWVAHLQQMGVGYGEWALYPYDEASGSLFDELLAFARVVKDIDPKVRIYADLGGILPRPEQLVAARALLDIYQPWQGHFEEETTPWLEELKATGKPVWMYRESNHMKELGALGYYRRMPWLAWERGLVGIGIFDYLYSDPWLVGEWQEEEFGMVYPLPTGVAPSKRWEAVREGIQDYEALWLLRQGIADAERRGKDAADAQRLLREASKRVLASGADYDVIIRYRERVAKATLELWAAAPRR